MRLGKIALTALAWMFVTVVAAAALEVSFGTPRPGFVQPLVWPVLAPMLLWIWRRPLTWPVREWLWAAGILTATTLLEVVLVVTGIEHAAPPPADWLELNVVAYVVVTVVRAAIWVIRNRSIDWRDAVIVLGVCLLVYGWSERGYSSDEQPWLIGGAALATYGALQLRRRA